jgi:hypothetical protein
VAMYTGLAITDRLTVTTALLAWALTIGAPCSSRYPLYVHAGLT